MMKLKTTLLTLSLLTLAIFTACATDNKQKDKSSTKKSTTEINWLSFEEAEKLMKEKPKKVLIDMYTDWCGWCKVMDRKTYSSPALIQYVNENYYAIKFNAEQKQPVTFMGKQYQYMKANRAHEIAITLMQGRMSYPTTIFMDENFQNPTVQPGYLELPVMEGILKYLGSNSNKSMPWNDFQRNFKAEWTL